MKKLLRFADCLVLLAAIIGCLCRIWMSNSGIDAKGLYLAGHPGWILLCVFSVAVVVFVFLVSRIAGDDNRYKTNFPRSVIGMVGYMILALVLAYNGIAQLLGAEDLLDQLEALLAMLSAVTLAVTGIERLRGSRPPYFLHMIPCVYLAVRMFLLGRDLGSEPQLIGYLFTFLGAVSVIPAFYWLWAFDVKMGSRRRSLFWSLCASYFCLIASFDVNTNWALHMAIAACLLANTCTLQYLPKPEPAQPAESTEPKKEVPSMPVLDEAFVEELAAEETVPAEEAVPAEDAAPVEEPISTEEAPVAEEAPAQAESSVQTEEDFDLDSFLSDLKLYLDHENE